MNGHSYCVQPCHHVRNSLVIRRTFRSSDEDQDRTSLGPRKAFYYPYAWYENITRIDRQYLTLTEQ